LKARVGHAIVVEKEADAHSAASLESHIPIVSFFDTSETCRYMRERMYPPMENNPPSMKDPTPPFSAPVTAPPPVAESAPIYQPGHGRQYTPSYGNAPSYSSSAYGNTPSYGNAPPLSDTPYGGTPYGNTPSYKSRLNSASLYTPQPESLRYQHLNRHQSANLPARASSSVYAPPPLTQSERLQELVHPYEQRPATYAYSSAPAAETTIQDSAVDLRNASVPAPKPLPYRIVSPTIPLNVKLQNTREKVKASGTLIK
jgi:hypothetical protein